MPTAAEHKRRMEEFWNRLRAIQDQIDRTKKVLEDARQEAAAVGEEMERQRRRDRERSKEHRWLR